MSSNPTYINMFNLKKYKSNYSVEITFKIKKNIMNENIAVYFV